MKIINIALRRDDGNVERDTVFREEMFTPDELRAISEKHYCDVIVSCVGTAVFDKEKKIEKNTFAFIRPQPVEVQNEN